MLNSIIALLNGGASGGGGSYESIATASGTGSSGTITFSSIPSTYASLQLRYSCNTAFDNDNMILRFNGSSSSYAWHELHGTGAAAAASGTTGSTSIAVGSVIQGTSTTYPQVGIIDIHDYASSTNNKTVRTMAGIDKNGSGDIYLISGLWINTAAVTSLTISVTGDTFNTSSKFALYGIKGA